MAERTTPTRSPEVAEADVAPQVPVKVDEDRIEAAHGAKELGDVVVGLDLRDVGIEFQAQA